MKLEGVFLYYDKENGNDRIYTKEISEDIVKQFKKHELNMFGELGQTAITFTSLTPSHVVTDIWIDEKDQSIKGTIEVLDTPKGKMLKELVTVGVPMSMASRGTGKVNEKGIVEDYELVSFDVIPTKESSFKGPLKIINL